MAQPATNPKIEELRFRLKTDPKSRLFYQLAEELRRAGQPEEAQQVLRSGLEIYPTYLAAWVSLGRTLRELRNDGGAVEALSKAMQLDPGNVVAARLLADAYFALGDKTEAIKKYKLVHALMPGDEDLKATIEALDRELHPPAAIQQGTAEDSEAPVPALPESHAGDRQESAADAERIFDVSSTEPAWGGEAAGAVSPDGGDAEASGSTTPENMETPFGAGSEEESPFDRTVPPFDESPARDEQSTGDAEPMLLGHEESPFEEPAGEGLAAAFEVEQPSGFHVDEAPVTAEVPAAVAAGGDDSADAGFAQEVPADVFEETAAEPVAVDDVADTITMADLHARQGLVAEARHIYENILARDPGNLDVRARLDAITRRENPKIERLERWLAKVSRKGVGSV